MQINSNALTGGGEGRAILPSYTLTKLHLVMGPRSKLMAIHPIHGYVIKPQEDLKTIKRNTRERNRVQTVNMGFDTLQRHIPTAAPVKKMSKVCVLQHAMEYIQNLCALLEQEPPRPQSSPYHQHHHHHQATPYTHLHHTYPHYPRHHPSYPTGDDGRHFAGYPAAGESGYESSSYYSDSQTTPSWHHATSTSSPPEKMHEKQNCSQIRKQIPLKAKKKQFGQVKSEKADSTTRKEEKEGEESSAEEDDVLDAIAEWQEV